MLTPTETLIGAVDIGGTKIAVGLVRTSGEVVTQTECPTAPESGPQDAVDRISRLLRSALRDTRGRLGGIGIACTGPVYPLTGTIGLVEFLPGWEGFNLVDALATVFDLPVAMENDADAAALAEAIYGAGRGASRFIYVTVSTGIGAGMVFDGRLYRGVDGAHPEIGHHVIDPSGPACICGAKGCWESLASGPAMARWYQADGLVDARTVCDHAVRGDPRALEAVRREAYYLGLGLANLVTLLTPDVIALGGGVMKSGRLFWDSMLAVIRSHCGYVPVEKTRITLAETGALVGLIGAACVWRHHFEAKHV